MRLFVALDPSGEALAHLQDAVAPVRREHPELRWTAPDRWHLTLAFLGEVDEPVLAELSTRLARACARHPTLDLALAGAGRFDGRVLWTGLSGDTEQLARLAASVGAAARRCGIEVEDRRYRGHLTLARSTRPVDLRPAVSALSPYAGPPWRADRVRLVRSFLGPRPRHDDVASWPLGPTSAPASPAPSALLTGVLAGDAGPVSVPHLLTADGRRFEVRWPPGWRLRRRPLCLVAPDGEVVPAGAGLTVRVVPEVGMRSTAQIGPIVRALEVLRGPQTGSAGEDG